VSDPLSTRRVAAVLGFAGGSLGVFAGLVQASAGPLIPQWTGAKDSPVALGALTVVLSGLAVLSAVRLGAVRRPTPGRHLAAAAGLAVPGALCFTTAGALWFPPGALLLAAAAGAVATGDRTGALIAANWTRVLVSALGGVELLMAAGAGPVATIAVGAVSGLALLAAPWVPDVRSALGLLVVGTLPFAALTWWTVVRPLLAVAALAIGLATMHARAHTPAEDTPC
jgi:hypothetical protein